MNIIKMTALILTLAFNLAPIVSFASDYYKVTVSRESQDLYKVQNEEIYIKTRNCNEDVYEDKSILRIDRQHGFPIGKITFSSGKSCAVEKLPK